MRLVVIVFFNYQPSPIYIHQNKFEDGIDSMRRILLDSPMYVSSTVLSGKYFNTNTGTK